MYCKSILCETVKHEKQGRYFNLHMTVMFCGSALSLFHYSSQSWTSLENGSTIIRVVLMWRSLKCHLSGRQKFWECSSLTRQSGLVRPPFCKLIPAPSAAYRFALLHQNVQRHVVKPMFLSVALLHYRLFGRRIPFRFCCTCNAHPSCFSTRHCIVEEDQDFLLFLYSFF